MVYKRYDFLDDLVTLYKNLQEMSMKELSLKLSEETGIPEPYLYGSIRFRVKRYFTEEMLSKIKRQRAFHVNKKKLYRYN